VIKSEPSSRGRSLPATTFVMLIALALAACTPAVVPTPGQPTPGQPTPGQPTPGQPTPGQPTPGQPTPGQPTPGAEGPLRLAFLSFAVANSYDAPMLAEAQNAAAAAGATLTVFDANNVPDTQYQQLQDVLTSGQYDGIIVQPIYGPALIPLIEEGIANGAHIAVVDQILGEDLTTNEKQVEGLAANVVFIMSEIGRKQGELVVQACAEHNLDPCNIGFIWSLKGISALDIAIEQSFNEVIAQHDNIQVVAEGQSFYTTHLGLTSTETMLVSNPEINMIVGADQAITGAVVAMADAGRNDIVLIGYGGAAVAYERIRCSVEGAEGCDFVVGRQYATVAQRPATEGRYVVEDLIRAIQTGEPQESRDPVSELPDDGIVTQENVGQFTPEWPG
jgi:ribose transport system substrate-binding protein